VVAATWEIPLSRGGSVADGVDGFGFEVKLVYMYLPLLRGCLRSRLGYFPE